MRPSPLAARRPFSSDGDVEIGVKYKAEIFELTSLYMEAKDALEDAQDSWDSTYFDEDFQDARDAVRELGDCYEGLRGMCSEEEIPELEKVVGLKLEEVKAAFEAIEEMALED